MPGNYDFSSAVDAGFDTFRRQRSYRDKRKDDERDFKARLAHQKEEEDLKSRQQDEKEFATFGAPLDTIRLGERLSRTQSFMEGPPVVNGIKIGQDPGFDEKAAYNSYQDFRKRLSQKAQHASGRSAADRTLQDINSAIGQYKRKPELSPEEQADMDALVEERQKRLGFTVEKPQPAPEKPAEPGFFTRAAQKIGQVGGAAIHALGDAMSGPHQDTNAGAGSDDAAKKLYMDLRRNGKTKEEAQAEVKRRMGAR